MDIYNMNKSQKHFSEQKSHTNKENTSLFYLCEILSQSRLAYSDWEHI